MEKTTYMISTHNDYEFEKYHMIFKNYLGGLPFAVRRKTVVRTIGDEQIYITYYTLAAKVDKKTEDILRNEIRLSHYPIYGKTRLEGGL